MLQQVDITLTSRKFQIPFGQGKSLPAQSWGDEASADAVALLVHGLGACGNWFEAFGRQCAERRIYAITFDLTGFGDNTGVKIVSYNQWLDDVVIAFNHVRERFPAKPVYLIGNSMGALLSLVATSRIQPDGLVLLSPGLDGAPETFTPWYRIITVIKALIWPDKQVALPYDESLFCRDLLARKFLHAELQNRQRLPGRLLFELLKLSNATKSRAHSVNTPVLMITAGQDRIVNNAVNEKFFQTLSAPKKHFSQYREAYHDLTFDPLVDEVADEVRQWMTDNQAEQ